jgi:hypothetical protein
MAARSPRLVESPALDALFNELDRLRAEDLLRLEAAWRSIDMPAHEKAWAAIRKVAIRERLSDEIEEVRQRALTWMGYDAVPYRYLDPNPGWVGIKASAAQAIADAAVAVALGDRLEPAARETLLSPWEGSAADSPPGRHRRAR